MRAECSIELINRACSHSPARTAVVNAVNAVVMESVRDASTAGLIEPVLIGEPGAVAAAASEVGYDISNLEIVPASGEEDAARLGAEIAGSGRAGAVMKGHLHTDIFMRALLQREAGLRIGRPFTHIFHMTVPGRAAALLITDAASTRHLTSS